MIALISAVLLAHLHFYDFICGVFFRNELEGESGGTYILLADLILFKLRLRVLIDSTMSTIWADTHKLFSASGFTDP